MTSTTRRLRIALAVPQGLPFLERLLTGIADHARSTGRWVFTRLPEALGTSVGWLRHWPGDGAFALIITPNDARAARRLPFPVVNLASHLRPTSGVPTVAVDNTAIGAAAARHLLDRHFRRFGYYGPPQYWYSRLRGESFARTVRNAGAQCALLQPQAGARTRHWRDQQRELTAWLASMRPPVGIMASNDLRATMVLEACRDAGLRVPEDVAIVGVDNDPIAGEFCDPPLTTVSRNDREVGRQAAQLLDRLIAGAARPTGPILVPPDGIIARRSTQTVAVEDPYVAQAVHFMREHVHRPFGVEQLLQVVPLSRRSLEYRFRASLGHSPYEYLTRVRVDAAQRLLSGPDPVKLAAVAAACGFTDLRRFRHAFRAHTGMTPATFRRAATGPAAPPTSPAR